VRKTELINTKIILSDMIKLIEENHSTHHLYLTSLHWNDDVCANTSPEIICSLSCKLSFYYSNI